MGLKVYLGKVRTQEQPAVQLGGSLSSKAMDRQLEAAPSTAMSGIMEHSITRGRAEEIRRRAPPTGGRSKVSSGSNRALLI